MKRIRIIAHPELNLQRMKSTARRGRDCRRCDVEKIAVWICDQSRRCDEAEIVDGMNGTRLQSEVVMEKNEELKYSFSFNFLIYIRFNAKKIIYINYFI
jgi:hypothetical protein